MSLHIVVGRSPRAAAASFVVSANRGWPVAGLCWFLIITTHLFPHRLFRRDRSKDFLSRPVCQSAPEQISHFFLSARCRSAALLVGKDSAHD